MAKYITIAIFILAILSSGAFYIYKNFGSVYTAIAPARSQEEAQKVNADSLTVSNTIKVPSGYVAYVLPFQFQKPRDLQKLSSTEFLVSDLSGSVHLVYIDPLDNSYKSKSLLRGLNNPHGLALGNDYVFLAEETSLKRYKYDTVKRELSLDKKILDLPRGGRHVTRSLALKQNGDLFVSLGSTCDTCVESKPWIGTVIKTNINGDNPAIFSKGLRNAVFLTLDPKTEDLYATEMGRDFLGDNLPSDEVNVLEEGQDYGWPYCHSNKVFDSVFNQGDRSYCEKTIAPVFQIQAHSAPLGLTFAPESFINSKDTLLVSYHGSWNSSTPKGYKIVSLTKNASGFIEKDFVTGFVEGNKAHTRPVDVEFLDNKTLLFSDDKGGKIYLIQKQ